MGAGEAVCDEGADDTTSTGAGRLKASVCTVAVLEDDAWLGPSSLVIVDARRKAGLTMLA